jgi:tetratricopeptide (TPR) repeat protein
MKLISITLFLITSFGCANAPQTVQQNSAPPANERSQTVVSHGNDTPPPAVKNGEKTKWSQSGEPIDTKEFDAAIEAAAKALGGKPADPALKKALAEAYYKRAVALTDARQYASALGDYRRTVKNDPDNKQAKDWIDQIINIYDGLNKESPKEGEEPPPLPLKKEK